MNFIMVQAMRIVSLTVRVDSAGANSDNVMLTLRELKFAINLTRADSDPLRGRLTVIVKGTVVGDLGAGGPRWGKQIVVGGLRRRLGQCCCKC